mmetsp:Transcript_26130/g.37122  ORF Transcript_26130/g.37122 Transcript_26130/m.37122 type:complete len:213 (-) Transcript_26130:379-1017(-)
MLECQVCRAYGPKNFKQTQQQMRESKFSPKDVREHAEEVFVVSVLWAAPNKASFQLLLGSLVLRQLLPKGFLGAGCKMLFELVVFVLRGKASFFDPLFVFVCFPGRKRTHLRERVSSTRIDDLPPPLVQPLLPRQLVYVLDSISLQFLNSLFSVLLLLFCLSLLSHELLMGIFLPLDLVLDCFLFCLFYSPCLVNLLLLFQSQQPFLFCDSC